MKLIERPSYLNALIRVKDTPDIKVITGIRRSGKSKLMAAFAEWVQNNIPTANIIHIDFNLREWQHLAHADALHTYIEQHYLHAAENFVLIDEVQNCKEFELTINSLHASEKYRIFITGSNAFLLSSDLATLFTGRTFEIEVFPFSFREFIAYHQFPDLQLALDAYLNIGGMSGAYVYEDETQRRSYVANIYKTLIIRDIRQKYHIRNEVLISNLCNFLMDNVANLTSVRSVVDALCQRQMTTNAVTIGKYVEHLTNAFLFHKVRRYDIRGKRYLNTQDKYYLSDHSFRYAMLGKRNMDYGRIYENMVAIELLRRGYEVYVGVLYKKEVDFVAMKGGEKIYIQVCDDLSNPKTLLRETTPLLMIGDAYPKMLIARTRHPEYDYEGIRIVDIAVFLSEE